MAPSSKSTSTRSETKLVQELADILDQAGLAELDYRPDQHQPNLRHLPTRQIIRVL